MKIFAHLVTLSSVDYIKAKEFVEKSLARGWQVIDGEYTGQYVITKCHVVARESKDA